MKFRDFDEEDPLDVEASIYKLNYINLDGSNDYIELGTFFNYTRFTIALWVYPGSTQNTYADILVYINNDKQLIHENVKNEYGLIAENNPVALYNNNRLFHLLNHTRPYQQVILQS